MTNKLIKNIAVATMGLIGVVGGLLCILILFAGPDTSGMGDKEKFALQMEDMSGFLDGILAVIGIAIGLAILIILAYFIISLIQRPKQAVGSLVGIGAVALILVISWFLADDYVNWGNLTSDKIHALNEQFTAGQRKFSGANVWAILIFIGITLLSIIGMEGFRAFRARK